MADTIRRAFIDYQNGAEERRRLGVDVSEVNARLIAAMTAAGFAEQEVRGADVRALAEGVYRAASEER